jgi:hypothetical protein
VLSEKRRKQLSALREECRERFTLKVVSRSDDTGVVRRRHAGFSGQVRVCAHRSP